MPKPISILFVATEAEPFIKTGSIGDVAGTLPKTVKAMDVDFEKAVDLLPKVQKFIQQEFAAP